jgi:ADP-heptose:LPS heptosyltransferase
VGDNEEKRLDDEFERELLARLAPREITLDVGASPREIARAMRAASGLKHVSLYRGDYAPFAAIIASSRLYIGYDSAGQHVAAAAGTPLVTVFAGYAAERMFQRWRPEGSETRVIQVRPAEPSADVLQRVLAAVSSLAHS